MDSATRVVPVLAAVQAAAAAHPQMQIAETGDATINKAVNDTIFRDLRRAEMLSFPITLVVLLIAFGAVVAALLPLALALMAILAATGLVAFTSHLSGETTQASSVMLCIGLAVGVDYSMFYVKRQREERAAGRPVLDAIEVAAATSGRSVLISGLTVLIAMSGMLLTGNKVFYGMAQAAMLVVAAAVIGSLTLLPALLALLGDRVDRGQLPFVSRLRPRRPEPGLDRGTRPGPGPPGADRRGARPACWWCSRCPCCACIPRNRASVTCRRTRPPCRPTTASSRCSRAAGRRRWWSSRRPTSPRPRCSPPARPSSGPRWPAAR